MLLLPMAGPDLSLDVFSRRYLWISWFLSRFQTTIKYLYGCFSIRVNEYSDTISINIT